MKFETKDSGKRQEFSSGMHRDVEEGKLRVDLALDGPVMRAALAANNRGWRLLIDWLAGGGVPSAVRFVELLVEDACRGDWIEAVERYAALMTRGAVKYDARNWMQAAGQEELERFRSSAARHFFQYWRGDEDEDHFAATIFNVNGAEYVGARLDEAGSYVSADAVRRATDEAATAAMLQAAGLSARAVVPAATVTMAGLQ